MNNNDHDEIQNEPLFESNLRKTASPLQTGFRYLKSLAQNKRRKILLERSIPFSTNYLPPLPSISARLKNKSIQVDDFDDFSFKTAFGPIVESSKSFEDFIRTFFSVSFFLIVLLYFQLNYRPVQCLFDRRLWHLIDLSHGYQCENSSNIEIHFVEIFSVVYQVEMFRNQKSMNCLGFEIFSCSPVDVSLIPKEEYIPRHDYLISYCNQTEPNLCQDPQMRWNEFSHCSCSTSTSCFHWQIVHSCDLQIPWFDYCLKQSDHRASCQRLIKH